MNPDLSSDSNSESSSNNRASNNGVVSAPLPITPRSRALTEGSNSPRSRWNGRTVSTSSVSTSYPPPMDRASSFPANYAEGSASTLALFRRLSDLSDDSSSSNSRRGSLRLMTGASAGSYDTLISSDSIVIGSPPTGEWTLSRRLSPEFVLTYSGPGNRSSLSSPAGTVKRVPSDIDEAGQIDTVAMEVDYKVGKNVMKCRNCLLALIKSTHHLDIKKSALQLLIKIVQRSPTTEYVANGLVELEESLMELIGAGQRETIACQALLAEAYGRVLEAIIQHQKEKNLNKVEEEWKEQLGDTAKKLSSLNVDDRRVQYWVDFAQQASYRLSTNNQLLLRSFERITHVVSALTHLYNLEFGDFVGSLQNSLEHIDIKRGWYDYVMVVEALARGARQDLKTWYAFAQQIDRKTSKKPFGVHLRMLELLGLIAATTPVYRIRKDALNEIRAYQTFTVFTHNSNTCRFQSRESKRDLALRDYASRILISVSELDTDSEDEEYFPTPLLVTASNTVSNNTRWEPIPVNEPTLNEAMLKEPWRPSDAAQVASMIHSGKLDLGDLRLKLRSLEVLHALESAMVATGALTVAVECRKVLAAKNETDSTHEKAWADLAIAFLGVSDYINARDCLSECLLAERKDSVQLCRLAQAFYDAGHIGDTNQIADIGLSHDRGNTQLQLYRGLCLVKEKKSTATLNEGVRLLDAARSREPGNHAVHSALAEARLCRWLKLAKALEAAKADGDANANSKAEKLKTAEKLLEVEALQARERAHHAWSLRPDDLHSNWQLCLTLFSIPRASTDEDFIAKAAALVIKGTDTELAGRAERILKKLEEHSAPPPRLRHRDSIVRTASGERRGSDASLSHTITNLSGVPEEDSE